MDAYMKKGDFMSKVNSAIDRLVYTMMIPTRNGYTIKYLSQLAQSEWSVNCIVK